MDVLILSCSTGGGHNAAGRAVKEEMERRGHHVVMFDPYALAGEKVERRVSRSYVAIAQRTPRLFGVIYTLGNGYRRLPFRSPVYFANKAMIGKMQAYLAEHHFDAVFMPHVFPGEILTYMKDKGMTVPKMFFIATDYVCTPFTEETKCDYYITPAKELADDFIRRGIPAEKLIPAGIPVAHAFSAPISREQAIEALGLDADKRYLLISGGSMGAGVSRTIGEVLRYMQHRPDRHLIVICGNNQRLLADLRTEYGENEQLTLLGSTDQMALYMKAADVYLSKPGGLSSTEAAVSGTPLIHISPIPGCENKNMAFFAEHGMSIAVGDRTEKLTEALEALQAPDAVREMRENQKKYINGHAASDICDLAERVVGRAE